MSAQRTPLRGISALPIGGGLVGGMAIVASPQVRALAAEWVVTSQAYFRAVEDWGTVVADSADRPAVEAAVDAAVLADENVRRRIVDMRSTEPGAMALKVAAAQAHMRGRGGADAVVADHLKFEGPLEEALALALVRDMAEAIGPAVQALAAAGRPERRA